MAASDLESRASTAATMQGSFIRDTVRHGSGAMGGQVLLSGTYPIVDVVVKPAYLYLKDQRVAL